MFSEDAFYIEFVITGVILAGLLIAKYREPIVYKNLREKDIIKKCGCICYCPECEEPLNDQDCEELGDGGLIKYTCKCGNEPLFHFGIAPVPIYMKAEVKKERCTRVGYDLHECSCRECIELDIMREKQNA